MSTNRLRSSSKEDFWRRMMRLWRSSGLSVRAFCEEQGFSQPSFYAWRRTLAERDAAAVPFVPVRVAAEPQVPSKADGSVGAVAGCAWGRDSMGQATAGTFGGEPAMNAELA